MTCNCKVCLLIGASQVLAWATYAEACHHRRRACAPQPCGCGYSTYVYTGATGYYASQQGHVMDGGGSDGGGYGYGGRGYSPGGLGGPWSGLGVRPGLDFGGFGPGR